MVSRTSRGRLISRPRSLVPTASVALQAPVRPTCRRLTKRRLVRRHHHLNLSHLTDRPRRSTASGPARHVQAVWRLDVRASSESTPADARPPRSRRPRCDTNHDTRAGGRRTRDTGLAARKRARKGGLLPSTRPRRRGWLQTLSTLTPGHGGGEGRQTGLTDALLQR